MKSGIINIYKEKGFTSFDVVAKLRGILHIKKIGHTGTLDPEAEGVLPICIGKATKACSMLLDTDKKYLATMLLGKATDTYDVYGNVTEKREVNTTPEEVEAVIQSFIGEIDQVPPMYSAIKINGKKLYELARAGKVVDRPSRRVTIYNEETHSIDIPEVQFSVECSKGTYIRSLCNDIGIKLGCLACMKDLVRTKAGIFKIEDSHKLSEIEKLVSQGKIDDVIIPVDKIFEPCHKWCVLDEYKKLCINGSKLPSEAFVELKINQINMPKNNNNASNCTNYASNCTNYTSNDTNICVAYYENDVESNSLNRVYLEDGTFVGLYRKDGETFIPEKMFYENI
ncbi:MAG: tRNA pseudouridine(55) synthase TruB [Lachnospiraceae bacterium]|nr:tRNA pseudouridine(55) synthase TruB [Lachnospiraceae bacterium]